MEALQLQGGMYDALVIVLAGLTPVLLVVTFLALKRSVTRYPEGRHRPVYLVPNLFTFGRKLLHLFNVPAHEAHSVTAPSQGLSNIHVAEKGYGQEISLRENFPKTT